MKHILKKLTRALFSGVAVATSFGILTASGVSAENTQNKDVNLVAGLPYTTATGTDITHSYAIYAAENKSETDPALGKLTDGKHAESTSFADSGWHKLYRGTTRTIQFELPEEKAITGFSVSGLQANDAGVALPPWFELYVSENGSDYMLAGRYESGSRIANAETNRYNAKCENIGRFKAKYIRVVFRTAVNVFIDEIEVYGGDIDGTEAKFVKTPEPEYKNQFDAGIEGCKDIVLLYCGYPKSGNFDDVQNTEEEMKYYFGYIGKDGEIKDTFFDSFMFSPLQGACPSGGNLNRSGKSFTVKSDWECYLESIFDKEYNCGAIERVVEDVKKATGKDDLAVNMIINLPYPTMGSAPFGDIDGDGEDEYCRNEEEQLAIYKWYFDLIEKYLKERNYKNIRLGGYYWEQESMTIDGSDLTLMRSVIDEAHSRGIKFFWIPLLYAEGFDYAYDNGFDCVMMQPNYSFLEYAEEKCFTELTSEIRKHGLGIEIEISWNAVKYDESLARYYSYLNAGYALGYMKNTAHSYYQNAMPGTYYHMAKSSVPKYRQAYDDTYAFVKGTYKPHEFELSAASGSVTSGKKLKRPVRIVGGYNSAVLGKAQLCILEQPSHGSVTLDSTNAYTYVPDEGFVGEDSFVVGYKAEYASSKPLTVTVTVKSDGKETSAETSEESEAISAESTASTVSTVSEAEKNGGNTAVAAVCGVAAGIAVIAGIVIALRKKKKK